MGIYFSNSDLKKLTSEQFITLGKMADAVGAETISEASDEERNEVTERCKQIKEQAEKDAQRQQELTKSFV